MVLFSRRHGYIKSPLRLIRGKLTKEITNAICTAYDLLNRHMGQQSYKRDYEYLEQQLWCFFLNKRLNEIYTIGESGKREYYTVAIRYIKSTNKWYKKLDLIEETLSFLIKGINDIDTQSYNNYYNLFVNYLNGEFERLNFAYRIIYGQVVEITSDDEIAAVNDALNDSSIGVKEHLQSALRLLSGRPNGDYRNSIKESISAVEVVVREITGADTLDIKMLEKNGIILPDVLKKSIGTLYGYTNNDSTGIRHALMNDTNKPNEAEATFMLVSCSAFVSYIRKKQGINIA